ncbi:MAG: DegV family protein [Patescibacteria group bacterium]
MQKIGFVTEDATDMPRELVERCQIAQASVKFTWPELEGMPGENTFQKMRELAKKGDKSFGKTSQPAVKDFLEKFEEQLAKFEKVICITITSKLSGSYNSANQAKSYLKEEDQKRLFIVDSLLVSAAQALLVMKAVDLMNENKTAEEIVAELEKFVPQVHSNLIFEDIKFVEASGRISHFAATLVRGMAKAGIRPVLAFKKGVLTPTGLKTGAKDIPTAIFRQLEKDAKEFIGAGKKIRVAIAHGDDSQGAQRLREMIESNFKNVEVAFVNIIDNVLGILAGPDAIIVAWCEV